VMREGKLEQVDRPQDLYERPRTLFVAQFLGRANLWPAQILREEGDRVFVAVAGAELEAKPLGSIDSKEVFLFFRPEWVELGEGPLLAEIKEAEYLGDHWEARGKVHGFPVILKTMEKTSNSVRFRILRAFLLPRT